ncbi:MAG TPA: 16S rRNA (adenine(1518)-N(6)/adenine(1519)-N(6))-dimethyltransferase RsmA [Gemmatimonadales bacterium]|nr:16S rRNA (adenine(1518)-N(6)/adenine(1519)-N(6))-dimethyltransferase RsmA [Gemmatimonadales bacterium]
MPRAKRELGQHFLSDPSILRRIVAALNPDRGDVVLEIGSGQGSLTSVLLERVDHVIAVERDRDLVPGLRQDFPSATIIQGDALDLDWHALATGRPFLVVGNIPYQITTPLIDKALTPPRPARIVFLIQREVAERLTATPGTKAYGALTIGVQAMAQVERLFRVPAGAFHPPPQVQSAVVRLTPRREPLVADRESREFRRLVVGLFGFRRKQLLRAVRGLTGLPAGPAAEVLERAGVAASIRPEGLAPPDCVRLFRCLVDGGWWPR